VDILCWNGNWMKIVVSVLVIILNYIGSKLLVFKK
jgi:putative flippase GtrA